MNDPQSTKKAAPSYLGHVMAAGGDRAVTSTDALSKALSVGFGVLKLLMVVLAVVFCFSNIYWVPEGSIAIQTRFGAIVDQKSGAVRLPGGPYLAFPFPVDQIVRIPTSIQKKAVFNAFWSETDKIEPSIDDRPETDALRPGVHGSLVTADKNLVQGSWVIHYKVATRDGDQPSVAAASDFAAQVGSMEQAGDIIRRLAQAAIVRVVAQTDVAEFVAGQIDHQTIKRIVNTRLEALETGLTVTGVSASQYAVPKVLMADFQAVNQAESQKALAIEKASRQRVSTLNELAGSGWQELLKAIEAHEEALQTHDPRAEQAAFDKAGALFEQGDIGGAVKQTLNDAKSTKTTTIQRARAAAARFNELLPSYEKNGAILKSQLVQDTIRRIWSDISVDALYVPPGQKLFLDLGRTDPMAP